MYTEIGNGSSTLFWHDRWSHGRKIEDFAPRLIAVVPRKFENSRTVQNALIDRKWLTGIKGALTVGVLYWLIFLMYGMPYWQSIYSHGGRTCISSDLLLMENTLLKQHMTVSSLDQLNLSIGRGNGRLGRLPNASFFFGRQICGGAGQKIGCPNMGSVTRIGAHFVIKSLRLLIIFLWDVSLLGLSDSGCWDRLIFRGLHLKWEKRTPCNGGKDVVSSCKELPGRALTV